MDGVEASPTRNCWKRGSHASAEEADGWMNACAEYDLEEITEAVKELERTKRVPEGAFLGGTKVPDAVIKACKTYVDYRQDAQKKVQEYADPSSERLLPDLPVRESIDSKTGSRKCEACPPGLTDGSFS